MPSFTCLCGCSGVRRVLKKIAKSSPPLYEAKGSNCHNHDQNYSYRELGGGKLSYRN